MDLSNTEYEIVSVDRYNSAVIVRWWDEYTVSVRINPTKVKTREDLYREIELNRPTVIRHDGPIFDIAESILKEQQEAEALERKLPPVMENGVANVDELLAVLEEEKDEVDDLLALYENGN